MNCEKLFEKIEELYPKYVKIWEDVCNIESPTNNKKAVDEACYYLVKLAEEKGWEIEILKQKVAGDVACITLNPNAKGEPVCFSGHLDTVHPIGLFGTPAVKTDEEKIYGPGVIDCKGGVVASFLAMDALEQVGFTDRPVKLILQSDEETSSITSGGKTIEFMCEKAKGAIAFFNMEGVSAGKEGKVTLTRKGIMRFKYNITGKAAHSSKCMQGANAILEAAYKITELEKFKDEEGLTSNCGVIEGGTVANTVPEKCSFVLDVRFKTAEEEKSAREFIKEISDKTYVKGCSCVLEEISYRPAMEHSEKNVDMLNKINAIYKEVGLQTLEPQTSAGGSDAAYITKTGVPCVDSIGVSGARIHSVDEYAILKSLATSAKYLASAAMFIR